MTSPGYFDSFAAPPQAGPPSGSEPRDSAECDDEREDDDQQVEDDFDQDDDDAALTFREMATEEEEVRAAYAEMQRGFDIMARRRATRRWLDENNAEVAATNSASAINDAATAESIDTTCNEPSNESDALPRDRRPPTEGIMSPKMQSGRQRSRDRM